MRKPRSTISRRAAVVVAAVAIAVPLAPLAAADQYGYLAELDQHGVSYTSIPAAINAGKLACTFMRSGSDPNAVYRWEIQNQRFAPAEAAWVVVAASKHMCPDTAVAVKAAIEARGKAA